MLPIKKEVKLTTDFLTKLDKSTQKTPIESKTSEIIASSACSTRSDSTSSKTTISSRSSSITITSLNGKAKRCRRILPKSTESNDSDPVMTNLDISINAVATQKMPHIDVSSVAGGENTIIDAQTDRNESCVEMNDASRHLVKKTPLKESHQEASCVTSPLKNITSITNIFDKMINSSHRQKKNRRSR